jgi:hypothetical protein
VTILDGPLAFQRIPDIQSGSLVVVLERNELAEEHIDLLYAGPANEHSCGIASRSWLRLLPRNIPASGRGHRLLRDVVLNPLCCTEPVSISVDRRFRNQESATVHVVRFRFAPVHQFLEALTSVFRTIDFADEYQAELGRNLWRLRCSVLFGLAPYDHEGLDLLAQGERLFSMAERLPSSRESSSQLIERLLALLEQTENPKLEWIVRHDWAGANPAAIFALMAMRKSFGSDLITQLPDNPVNQPQIITSLDQIGTGEYSTLIIPGTIQYLSQSLFMKLFHLGEYSRIHVLLYEGEAFRPRELLRLPESSLLPGGSEGNDLRIKRSDVVDSTGNDDGDVDKRITDKLFTNPGEATLDDGRGILSRFVLCDDGKGFYVAESKSVRVWRGTGSGGLLMILPAQLTEGDFVIIEKGDRRALLSLTNNHQKFETALDATKVWREPLQSLLLTRSLEEVAILISETGQIPERIARLDEFWEFGWFRTKFICRK